MITNDQYLVQRYAEAREKMNSATAENGRFYWKGAENMGYDEAHAHCGRLTRERLVEEGTLRDC